MDVIVERRDYAVGRNSLGGGWLVYAGYRSSYETSLVEAVTSNASLDQECAEVA